MNRLDCEAKIVEKLREIEAIAKEYCPDCRHLSLTIIDGNVSVNNRFWKENADRPINAWVKKDEDFWEGYYE